ncbi:MAG: hypothetical protein KIT20_13880 [Alphaproteobacteria bacterium]|nr:hypothetical protein [Alphaproteobacteria bacterium]
MNRVGTYNQSYWLQQAILQRQDRLAESQRQVASGYKANDFKGVARDATALLATKSLISRSESFTATGKLLKLRLDQYDAAMGGLRASYETIKQEIVGAIAKRDASNLMNQVGQLFDIVSSQLTSQVDGKYIFGGTRNSENPLGFSTIGDLLALPDAASGFLNNQTRSQAQVDDNLIISDGILADEIGAQAMQVIRNIARFHAGTLDAGAGAPQLAAPHLAGATTLTLDGSTGTLAGSVVPGDTITFAGDPSGTIHTVSAAATAAGDSITIDIAPPLQQSFAAGTAVSFGGPFGSEITPQQRQFLEEQLGLMAGAIRALDLAQAENGIRQQQIAGILERQEGARVTLRGFEADLQEVDLTEAISRLNQDQIALEANLRVVSQIGRLSLLDFLR